MFYSSEQHSRHQRDARITRANNKALKVLAIGDKILLFIMFILISIMVMQWFAT